MKSDDLLKRDFTADKPCEKCVTDITELPAKDGKLYTSVIFDCYDFMALGISMADNMRAELCVETLKNAVKAYSDLRGAVLHSDRGSHTNNQLKSVQKIKQKFACMIFVQIFCLRFYWLLGSVHKRKIQARA